MSSPPPVSENTAPGSPVIPSASDVPTSSSLSDGALPSPPSPHSVAPGPLPPSVSKLLHKAAAERVQRAATFGEDGPQLSERESIFATHYLPSDSNASTPRVQPLTEGRLDLASTAQNVASSMELPHPQYPATHATSLRAISAQTKQLVSITPLAGSVVRGKSPYGPSALKTAIQEQGTNSVHGIRRVASEGTSWGRRFQVTVPVDTIAAPKPVKRMPAQVSEVIQSLEGNEEIKRQESDLTMSPQHERPSTMRDAMGSSQPVERSASRGRTHVEKTIEATLNNAEPSTHVRSRKSSHYMGLFRENNTKSPDSKKRDGREREKTDHDRAGDDVEDQIRLLDHRRPTSNRHGSSRTITTLNELQERSKEEPEKDLPRREGDHHFPDLPVDEEPADEPSSALSNRSNREPGRKTPVRQAKGADDFTEKQMPLKFKKYTSIPPQLLEDIRNHHNLTPGADRYSSFSKSLRTPISERQAFDVQGRRSQDESEDVDKEDWEVKEHISSALYYPHQGLSPEEVEQLDSPELQPQDTGAPGTPLLGASISEIGSEPAHDTNTTEHVDISLHAEDDDQVFHGDYQRLKGPAGDVTDPLPTIDEVGPEAVFESEFESLDEPSGEESSRTDGQEVTPKGTPSQKFLKPPKRHLTPFAGPIGAVELKPFSHQVGGHSTVFRFSRRAVCKQLNNRENEFYERIERRHPDMLRFLPRYIGVLNVTFSKGPKRQRATSDGNSKQHDDKDQVVVADDPATKVTAGSAEPAPPRPSKAQEKTDHQRVVSQSQTIGETPQVILENNRHIAPFSLFGLPERPRSVDPTHLQRSGHRSPERRVEGVTQLTGGSQQTGLSRPHVPTHSPSWGTTTVNTKLRQLVLQEVFGSGPTIHRHRHHAPGHSTLPRLRNTTQKPRPSVSEDRSVEGRHSGNGNQMQPPHTDANGLNNMHSPEIENAVASPTDMESSASVFELNSTVLEKVKSHDSLGLRRSSSNVGQEMNGRQIRRRHSGMGLRRRRYTLNGKEDGDLEYFEEDGYRGDEEDAIFSIEDDAADSTVSTSAPLGAGPLSNGVPRLPIVAESAIDAPDEHENEAPGQVSQMSGLDLTRLPVNPKEAQAQTAAKEDQRVQFFLLLEDLTAGMSKPCVLDLKMGTRQYGIEANEKKQKSQRRKCKTTTSQQLGVRVCGMQTWNVKKQEFSYEDKYFGRDLKAGREFQDALTRFLYDGVSYSSVVRHIPVILGKISKLENMIRRLPGYRFYASSLLMLYDGAATEELAKPSQNGEHAADNGEKGKKGKAKKSSPIELKIVDFANCVTGEDDLPPNASCPPAHSEDIDRGYLRGLRTLRMYFQRILKEVNDEDYVERGEGEGGREQRGPDNATGWSDSVMEDNAGEVSI